MSLITFINNQETSRRQGSCITPLRRPYVNYINIYTHSVYVGAHSCSLQQETEMHPSCCAQQSRWEHVTWHQPRCSTPWLRCPQKALLLSPCGEVTSASVLYRSWFLPQQRAALGTRSICYCLSYNYLENLLFSSTIKNTKFYMEKQEMCCDSGRRYLWLTDQTPDSGNPLLICCHGVEL